MRTLLAIGVMLLGAAAVVLSTAASVQAATVTVEARDFDFNPPTINIEAGDTVRWDFVGATLHNVTAVDGSFTSPDMTSGTYERTFNSAGSFAYYCTFHGNAQGQGMSGTVVVAAAETPTNTAEATEEPTDTPEATGTAETTSTPAPVAPPTAVDALPISAPDDAPRPSTGGAAPETVGVPNTGAGPGGADIGTYTLALTLAATGGLVMIGAAAVGRRRVG